jgi:integrase-like protein
LGRRATSSAFHCATEARYSSLPPRVAALRRSSREIVDGDRPISRAISLTPLPSARNNAISSRSAKQRYRHETGSRSSVAIPPRSRNHRTPAADETPTAAAASSLLRPLAISRQNHSSTSRRCDGLPGDFIAERPVSSFIHPAGRPIATPHVEVLRRPVESAQYTSFDYTQTLADHGVLASVGPVGDAYDNALAESFVDSFKTELIADRVWRTRSQLELAVVEYIGWFNHTRLHQALGDMPPAEMEALYAPRTETKISLEMKRGSQLTRSP